MSLNIYHTISYMHPIWLPVDQPINQPYGPWDWNIYLHSSHRFKLFPGIPTIIKTMGVNITTIAYLRVLIIEIGSTIILMVVEAQGIYVGIYTMSHLRHCGNWGFHTLSWGDLRNPYLQNEQRSKPLDMTFHYTGWFLRILIVAA